MKDKNVYLTPVNDKYAILTVRKDFKGNTETLSYIRNFQLDSKENLIPPIIYVKTPQFYTLQELSPIDASGVEFVQHKDSLDLKGKGTLVGIIDTGIDYLNEEFSDYNGKTRITTIWDQTINSNDTNINREVPYGSIFNRNEIDHAIEINKSGGDAYSIVPSKDEIGHGTNMAGIIGAIGKNPELKGVAPECEFAVVKLNEDARFKLDYGIKVPIYNITSIFMAIEYLLQYSIDNNKPIVIFLPLGTSSGNHKGDGILQQYIESVVGHRGVVVVSGAGNEGAEQGHTAGTISNLGGIDTFDIDVGEEQKFITLEVWIDRPDIMSIEIISPSGENTGIVPLIINSKEEYTFIFEKTKIVVNYFIPEQISGDELILVYFFTLRPGRWKIRLTSNKYNKGLYNAWIPQKGITVGDTKLIPYDPCGTLTIPGDSSDVITAASYNQNNNNIVDYSGVSLRNISLTQIDVAAGGEKMKTISPNNKVSVISGTSVSAAVLAGVSTLVLEWGIVNGYNPYMFSETLRSYLIRGTVKREGDIYPNPEWGFGILNVFGIFENIR
ncbi:S8 family peptidase [Clostridium paraputrificum]|uniref:S8 family peptidase n=1 Tax=Clostridium paraputrificum TaxID=29363 RepID=UPI003D33D2EB